MMNKRIIITEAKRKIYECDAATIAFYRRNPVIAAEDLLGVRLLDAQAYILESTWNASISVWACSRNFGKSFVGSIYMILKALLYENQNIYIVSNVGDQAKETFTKIEEIIRRIGKTAASIRSLKDIVEKETCKSATNKTGFSHNPAGYEVSFYNGSHIYTLNSKPDNIRGKRANVIFFDEAAFCSDELIAAVEPFATQSAEFETSTDSGYNPETQPKKVPNQIVYASSQDNVDKYFYKKYREAAKKMIAGDRRYFCCDMTCETALNTYMRGKPYKPLFSREKVESAIKTNKEKGMREYYNKPTLDGGTSQIIKWASVRKNESFYLPILKWQPNQKIALAFDPARTNDNSIIGAMRIYEDPDYGICGDIVNLVNQVDTASKNKYKLDSNRQLENLRQMILDYNGQNPDYEYIDSLSIDAGAGGGGQTTYADGLLNDWCDKNGKEHRGFIDRTHPVYAELSGRYPNASDKLHLISPQKYRTQMVEEFIELFDLGVIRLPYEFKGQNFIQNKTIDQNGEEKFNDIRLSDSEVLALTQLDLMKIEITSICKTENQERTNVRYSLPPDKINRMHDDRFYVMIMLAHRLYELRRGRTVTPKNNDLDITQAPICVSSL